MAVGLLDPSNSQCNPSPQVLLATKFLWHCDCCRAVGTTGPLPLKGMAQF